MKEHGQSHMDPDGLFRCRECGKVFQDYMMIRKHFRAFHGPTKYPCPHCERIFPRSVIWSFFYNLTWAASRKNVPNGLSHCHTKRRMACISFFLYDTDFFFWKVGVIPKEGSSFGMTPTQALRGLFVWRHPYYYLILDADVAFWCLTKYTKLIIWVHYTKANG